MSRNQRGKGLLGTVPGILPQQLHVVIHHSHYTCKPVLKAYNLFRANTASANEKAVISHQKVAHLSFIARGFVV